jgi:molecular chaperone DnaK (HSP70)
MLKYTGSIYKWGYQIKELEERHEWFKLDLDPTQSRAQSSLASKYPSDSALPPSYDVSYEKLIIDFLTALRQNAEYVLSQKLPSVVLRTTPREWIITIPAMWSDSAKAKARACAERAGMGSGNKLHGISEPEAAAVYALHAMDPHNIKVGDTFVVCDAGGG